MRAAIDGEYCRPPKANASASAAGLRPQERWRLVHSHFPPHSKPSIDPVRENALVVRCVNHSRRVHSIARRFGWLPGARYTNLRDIRDVDRVGLLDIDWQRYDFHKHLAAVKAVRPLLTVALDITHRRQLGRVLDQALQLAEYGPGVIIVPKATSLGPDLQQLIPDRFVLGYSVPTRYGGTRIPIECFGSRPIHLLGGRPDVQRRLAERLNIISLDCNRFTLDAGFGDYFDGTTFRRHPRGGYERCIRDSLRNINQLWRRYAHQGTGFLRIGDHCAPSCFFECTTRCSATSTATSSSYGNQSD